MENDSKVSRIIFKIKSLLNLSESTHSQAEREASLSLAQKMIAEYQVSQAEIDAARGNAEEQDNLEGKIIFETQRSSSWKKELVASIAELNNCYCVNFAGIRGNTTHKRGSRFRVFGKPSDIELCQYMFDYLVKTISDLSKRYVPYGEKRGINPERESWSLGCVRGFVTKMKIAKAGVLAGASQSTAMVLVNRPAEIREKLEKEKNMHLTKSQASKAQLINSAFTSGFQKGGTLNVNSGLNTTAGAPKLNR